MNSEVEIAIKEYYDINEKIKQLEKRKSELKEVLYSVFDSRKTNELKAENIIFYRVNRQRISWDESILKSILVPKGLWESVLAPDNNKIRSLIEKKLILETEINNAKISSDSWYTYVKQTPIKQEIQPLSSSSNIEEIKGIRRLVITDLSKMHYGRICIFGFDEKKRQIRPVIPYSGINEGYIFDNENKQIIKPFAEVEFDFIRPLPEPPHMEDCEINTEYKPKLIRNLSENESKRFLEEILDESVNAIFGESIQNHQKIITGGSRSIGTIRINEVLSVNYSIKQGDKYEYRITFSDMNGEIYDLPITDFAFRKHCDDQITQGKKINQINHDLKEIFNCVDLFLRIGLSRRWQEFYWLLVSGVHSFPDYRLTEYESKVEPFDIQNEGCTQKINFSKNVEILSNDIDGSNRAHAAYLLGESKNPAFVEILCKATKDPDGNVRRMAASALGKIGDKRAIDALICLLYDNKHQVRQYAIKALGDIGDERVVPELLKFKDDSIIYIKKAIDTAIKNITKFKADLYPINSSGSAPERTNFTLQTPASSKPERVNADINKVSMSKHDVIGALKLIIIELHYNKESASLGEIITKAAIVGIEKDDVEEAIQILKRTGEIYENHDEQFRIIE